MSRPGIDHPLVLVRDIERARTFYARLGFTLTPVGLHPWGTSTSLAVLERSALELMGIYDESLIDALAAGPFRFGRHMRDALAEREGLSLVALHSRDVEADLATLTAGGTASQGTIGFRRRVKPPGRDWDEAIVSLGILLDPALPRASHFLARQHKPELLWVPDWMRHANGARHVAAVTYVAADPGPVLRRLEAMFGPARSADPARRAGPAREVATGQGVFRVVRPEEWGAVFADAPRPDLGTDTAAAGAAIDVAVADLAATGRLLAAAGVATQATPGGLAVADVEACGNTLLRFVAAG